jgi:hypothetical protein
MTALALPQCFKWQLIRPIFCNFRTFVEHLTETPPETICSEDPLCLDVGDVPLLKNIRTSLIDPDTPESVKKIQSADGAEWELVVRDKDSTPVQFFLCLQLLG